MTEPEFASEAKVRAFLRRRLEPHFETFEEVPVRHALFRRRRLRVDVLAVPRNPVVSDVAIAFETKSDRDWCVPDLAQALKQSGDYVLATIEPDLASHAGKRVMAAFIYPAPEFLTKEGPPVESLVGRQQVLAARGASFLSGMMHMATYSRVGFAQHEHIYGIRAALSLRMPEVIWTDARGWRGNARHILAGKRQIGSQRFSILDELRGL